MNNGRDDFLRKTIRHYGKIILNLVMFLVAGFILFYGVPKLLIFFAPFVVGWIISSLAYPPVVFIEKHLKIRRKPVSAFIIMFAVAVTALLVYSIGSILAREAIGFIENIPQAWQALQSTFMGLSKYFDDLFIRIPEEFRESVTTVFATISEYIGDFASGMGKPTVNALGNFAKNIPSAIVSIIMCLLSAYFFVAEREGLTSYARKYTPKFIQDKWMIVYNSISSSLGGYIKAQVKIECIMYFIILIGLLILKVKYATFIAIGIAFLDLLPVFGTGTVLVPWAIYKIIDGDYKVAIGLAILWGVSQLIRQIIQPKIVGDSIGLAPLPTLFLIYIGWQFGGVVGMLIAVPIGVLMINLSDAGVFDSTKETISILSKDIKGFKTYTKEDRDYHKHYGDTDEKL